MHTLNGGQDKMSRLSVFMPTLATDEELEVSLRVILNVKTRPTVELIFAQLRVKLSSLAICS